MSESTHSITLRPATPEDEDFLFQLYSTTRDEFQLLDWSEQQKQALIKMQYDARRLQYDESYPEAEDNIILDGENAIGRMLVNESDREITLVDIALLPVHRNVGTGATLIHELLKRAGNASKPVRLHVLKNSPALRLYERLGFSRTADHSMYFEMTFDA